MHRCSAALKLVIAPVALSVGFAAQSIAEGPADRVETNPHSIVSAPHAVKTLAVSDLTSWVAISSGSLSRDGMGFTYISDISGRANVWMMSTSGNAARQVLQSNERQDTPVFSHDGKEIAFVQDKSGDEMFDIYAVPIGGGQPRNLTKTDDFSEYGPIFSPNGGRLAFITKERGSPTPNLGVMDWPGGHLRALTNDTDPKANWTPAGWSPDGNTLYAVRVASVADSDVFSVDVATGATKNLTAHPGSQRLRLTAVSPDGHKLLITSNEKGGFFNVLLFDIPSRTKRWVTDTQWEASSGGFSADGRRFSYVLNADGRTSLWFVDTATLAQTQQQLPPGLNDAAASPQGFLPDGSFLASHQDSTHVANLFVIPKSGPPRQITHNGSEALAAADLPRSQVVTYKSFDGRLISAFLWVPFNLKRDGSTAAVVLPHGGPTDQTVDEFNRRAALLVSRGIMALAPNVRGSTGYGMEFQRANLNDLGGADLQDEIAGVEFLKATGYVDAKKIGIWGGSYGGFMTLMAIGKRPDLWAAAVDEYGILDWSSMVTRSEPELQEYLKSLMGDPQKNKDLYVRSSPLTYIHQAKAPLLVLQGERDIRVPKEEAERLVSLLKADGKTVEAVTYPEEGHGFQKREVINDELTRVAQWFDRYLARNH